MNKLRAGSGRACGILLAALTALFLAAALHAQEGGPTAFKRDALNAGLPDAPDTLDRSTPQSSMEAFLAAGREGDWDTARHLLDLALIPKEAQREAATSLASALYAVIDRKVLLSWEDLSGRPDALLESGGDNAMAGEPRKSLLLGILTLEDRPVSIRLNRVLPEGGEPVWVFSAPTVDNALALYNLYGPRALERAMPEWLKAEMFRGLRLWEVLFLPIALGLIVLAAITVYRLITRLAEWSNDYRVRGLVRATRVPLTIVTGGFLLDALTGNVLVVSSAASAVIEPTILLAYVGSAILLAINVIDAVLDRVVDSDPTVMASPDNATERSLATGISAARRFLLAIGLILGVGIVLSSANIFRELGFSLIASAGVLSLVLAFAAREVLSNILASLQISLNRSARIGDFLEFDGHWCTVEGIYFTFVQLRLWTGNRLIVPVSYFVQEQFENWSLVEFGMLRRVEIKLASTAEVQPLRERMERFAREDGRVDPPEDAFCYVTAQDAFGKTALFAIPVPEPDAGWAVECDLREILLDEAKRIDTALPAEPPRPEAA